MVPDAKSYDDDWETIPMSEVSAAFNCVDRWRNAQSDMWKKTYAMLEESGIFVATCHHRFVLLACNMVKSGEL